MKWMNALKKLFVLLLLVLPLSAHALTDCERANNLRFISSGSSEGELIAKAGRPDYASGGAGGWFNGIWFSDVIYTYFPLCSNQTRYTIKVRGGVVTDAQNEIQR